MSPTEHTLVEIGEIRRGDKGLATSLHGIHQGFAAGTIKLTHHIVQKKNRLLLQELFHHRGLSELVCEHDGALLALTSEQGSILVIEEESDGVTVRSHKRSASTTLFGGAVIEGSRQSRVKVVKGKAPGYGVIGSFPERAHEGA